MGLRKIKATLQFLKVERNHVQCINSNGHQGAIPLDAKNLDLVKSDRKYPSLM